MRGCSRCERNARTDREDRIEDRAGRSTQRPPLDNRTWCSRGATTPDKLGAVGLEFEIADRFSLDHRQMRGPHLFLLRFAPPSCR